MRLQHLAKRCTLDWPKKVGDLDGCDGIASVHAFCVCYHVSVKWSVTTFPSRRALNTLESFKNTEKVDMDGETGNVFRTPNRCGLCARAYIQSLMSKEGSHINANVPCPCIPRSRSQCLEWPCISPPSTHRWLSWCRRRRPRAPSQCWAAMVGDHLCDVIKTISSSIHVSSVTRGLRSCADFVPSGAAITI